MIDTELLKRCIRAMVGKSLMNKSGDMEVISSYTKAKEFVSDAIGITANHLQKILRKSIKEPRKYVIEGLTDFFGVSFYLEETNSHVSTNKEEKEFKEEYKMNYLAQKTIAKIYSYIINYLNTCDIEDEEAYYELLNKIEEYEIVIPDNIYMKVLAFLTENLGENLPEIEEDDIVVEGNVIPNEQALYILIGRHAKRCLEIKKKFVEFSKRELAPLVR